MDWKDSLPSWDKFDTTTGVLLDTTTETVTSLDDLIGDRQWWHLWASPTFTTSACGMTRSPAEVGAEQHFTHPCPDCIRIARTL